MNYLVSNVDVYVAQRGMSISDLCSCCYQLNEVITCDCSLFRFHWRSCFLCVLSQLVTCLCLWYTIEDQLIWQIPFNWLQWNCTLTSWSGRIGWSYCSIHINCLTSLESTTYRCNFLLLLSLSDKSLLLLNAVLIDLATSEIVNKHDLCGKSCVCPAASKVQCMSVFVLFWLLLLRFFVNTNSVDNRKVVNKNNPVPSLAPSPAEMFTHKDRNAPRQCLE